MRMSCQILSMLSSAPTKLSVEEALPWMDQTLSTSTVLQNLNSEQSPKAFSNKIRLPTSKEKSLKHESPKPGHSKPAMHTNPPRLLGPTALVAFLGVLGVLVITMARLRKSLPKGFKKARTVGKDMATISLRRRIMTVIMIRVIILMVRIMVVLIRKNNFTTTKKK